MTEIVESAVVPASTGRRRLPFRVTLADPPWPYDDPGASGSLRNSGAAQHYTTLTVDQIAAINVRDVVADDALLYLWVTGPHVHDGLAVMDAWGFEFVTIGFTWVKTGTTKASATRLRAVLEAFNVPRWVRGLIVEDVAPVLLPSFPIGQGSYTRANPEYCLIGTRGDGVTRLDKGVRNEVLAPRRAHSEKPDEVHDRIERLHGDVPRLEMFARTRRPGWSAFGNEVDADVALVVPSAMRAPFILGRDQAARRHNP